MVEEMPFIGEKLAQRIYGATVLSCVLLNQENFRQHAIRERTVWIWECTGSFRSTCILQIYIRLAKYQHFTVVHSRRCSARLVESMMMKSTKQHIFGVEKQVPVIAPFIQAVDVFLKQRSICYVKHIHGQGVPGRGQTLHPFQSLYPFWQRIIIIIIIIHFTAKQYKKAKRAMIYKSI